MVSFLNTLFVHYNMHKESACHVISVQLDKISSGEPSFVPSTQTKKYDPTGNWESPLVPR